MGGLNIERILLSLPAIIIGLTVHEFFHAYVGFRCGDSTAKEQGRLSLNPMRHIDPLGFIFIVFAGFGWAKPVTFNDQNLRNPKTDTIKIAVAGPLSNAGLAMLFSLAFVFLMKTYPLQSDSLYKYFLMILLYGIYVNWGLFVFNMIPLPPLDGSHLIFHTLRENPVLYFKLYRYGTWVLFGILFLESRSNVNILPIGPVVQFLAQHFLAMLGY